MNVAVKNANRIGGFLSCAEVLHQLVRMKHVGSNLTSPFYAFLVAFNFRLCRITLLQFKVIKAGFEYAKGILTIVELASSLGVFYGYACRKVSDPHASFHLVHVLPARTAASERVPLDVGRIDFDGDCVIHERIDENTRESCLTLALSIERRYSHEAVHSILCLEIAVGIVSLNLYGSALYAGLFPFKKVCYGNLEALTLAVTSIHPKEHFTPVV